MPTEVSSMANTLKLKRSAVAGKIPQVGDLALGEIGLNTADGKAYMKTDDGAGSVAIAEIGTGEIPAPFALSQSVISDDYTLPSGMNAGSFSDVTIDAGVDVTLDGNSTWIVLD